MNDRAKLDKIDIREPHDGEIVRVNPDPKLRSEHTCVRVDGNWHLVTGNALKQVEQMHPNEIIPVTMFLTANSKQEFFVWPVERPVAPDHPVYVAMRVWVQIGRFNEKTECVGGKQ